VQKVFQHKNEGAPERYQYRECGLDNIWLHGGVRLEKEDGDEFLYIEDQDELHRVIALSIVERGDRMTGRELWFLRQELGLSQVQLARLIRQDVQAVARWEKGKSRLPGAADRLIRLLYLGHDRGTVDVHDLLQQLAETDAAPRDRVFEQANGGWHLAA
jgi:putative transcriptional regulator